MYSDLTIFNSCLNIMDFINFTKIIFIRLMVITFFTVPNENILYVLLHGWKHLLLQSISINYSLKCSELRTFVSKFKNWQWNWQAGLYTKFLIGYTVESSQSNANFTNWFVNFITNFFIMNFTTNFQSSERSSEHFSEKWVEIESNCFVMTPN